MFFGGIQKNSMIDYPGKISCVIFFSGCNFRCPYCHNPELVNSNGQEVDKNNVMKFLEGRKHFLDGVVLTGGEATLCNEIFDICKEIKEKGYPIKLDTNGSRPEIIKELIKKELVDYIAMDIKTKPVLYKKYIQKNFSPDSILSSIEIIMQSKINYEFRTTCVKPLITESAIKDIVDLIKGAKLYVLQKFVHGKILNPDFFVKNNTPGYNKEALYFFQTLAESRVKKCIIKG